MPPERFNQNEANCNSHSKSIAVLQTEMSQVQDILKEHAKVNFETAKAVAVLVDKERTRTDNQQNPFLQKVVFALIIILGGAIGGGTSKLLANLIQ